MTPDLAAVAAEREVLLRLRSIPLGIQLFERRRDETILRIRQPQAARTLDHRWSWLDPVGEAAAKGEVVDRESATLRLL